MFRGGEFVRGEKREECQSVEFTGKNAGLIKDCRTEAWLIYREIEPKQLSWLPVKYWIFTRTLFLTNRVKGIL